MNIATYISDLLYRYECVILPGFGAFLTQKKSAHFNEDAQAFFPPKKLISFNAQLKKNDGLLANYLAETKDISYPAAVYKLEEFVLQLNHDLEKKRKISLDNLAAILAALSIRASNSPPKRLFNGLVSLGNTKSVRMVLESLGNFACISPIFGKGTRHYA